MKRAPGALLNMRSAVSEIDWPPLSTGLPASVLALVQQLEQTQWLDPDELARRQRSQLHALLTHAEQQSHHFRQRLDAAGCGVDDLCQPHGLAALAPLSRRALQANGASIAAGAIPADHLPLGQVTTSGSSGTPVALKRSAVNQLFWLAFTLREHLWHRRDFSATLAVTRANLGQPEAIELPDWGPPAATFFATGRAYAMPINRDVTQQLDWLERIDPAYLLTYPTNLAAMLDELPRRGTRLPALRQIRTIGETLSPHTRQRVRDQLGVGIADAYSSQELGLIAIECPHSGLYHCMAEGYIVELLREDGSACAEGEIGRLVVTDLHNFATPLIRYDIGDYAEAGPACACGRGLPTLRRIVGRERNMVSIQGRRHWPLVGFHRFRTVAPVVQYQLIQRSAGTIDVNLVCEAALTEAHQLALTGIIQEALGHRFELRFYLFEERIPLPASGKFEEFVNLTT